MTTPLISECVPLTKLFEKDEPNVVVVVGAGVSMGSTSMPQASWIGLLKHGVSYLVATGAFTKGRGDELDASLDAAFSPFNLQSALQHAELVEQNLRTPNPADFAVWLEVAFKDLASESGKNDTLDALSELQQAGALLLTTNYDGLLSDATGLPPITWEEHDEVFRLIRRQRTGILHLHGHWKQPSSVVLGSRSYERIANDRDFQDVFRSLWLERSWVYVGCGGGLSDPNLGRLLEWGKRWPKDAPPDYFLAKSARTNIVADQSLKARNVVTLAYQSHADLPPILRSLAPAARCWPFTPVDSDFALFRSSASSLSIPFPSRQEYLDGDVPQLAADAEVRLRLTKHRWAFILDVASVGKTTLALRIAMTPEQRSHPTYYLDLGTVDADEAEANTLEALRRLSRSESLLILDNVHHRPDLARQAWDQWRGRPGGSKMLLIATRMHQIAPISPLQDLAFFEYHPTNPAIELRPTQDDLWHILKQIYRRVGGNSAGPMPQPPVSVLARWHRDYGSALGAFCLASLGQLAAFYQGKWNLPVEAASTWVREKWLKYLDAKQSQNALCLAVFAAQELELQVDEHALPYPSETDQLLRLGLVARTRAGIFGQYKRLSLREPGWGRLLLAAQVPAVDEERILFETAARHAGTALALCSRFRRNKLYERHARFWEYVAGAPQHIAAMISTQSLSEVPNLAQAAIAGNQPQLEHRFWDSMEVEPENLTVHIRESTLQVFAWYLETAARRQRDTLPLWKAVEFEFDHLIGRLWASPLQFVAIYLDTAKRHRRNSDQLWEALESEPTRLASRVWAAPIPQALSFLDTARHHERNMDLLWEKIEGDSNWFYTRVSEGSLISLGLLLDTAKRHRRDVGRLWDTLEREPEVIASTLLNMPLEDVASFLDTAKRHERKIAWLWEEIERDQRRLLDRACDTPLRSLAVYLDTAKRHQRDVAQLWEAVEGQPDQLGSRLLEASLQDTVFFLDAAKRHRRDIGELWRVLERNPERFASRTWESSLRDAATFLSTAKRHFRNTAPFWLAIEGEFARLAEIVWEIPLADLSMFFDVARQHKRNLVPLWKAIKQQPNKFANQAWDTSLEHVDRFMKVAMQDGCDVTPLWDAIEARPNRLIDQAWKTNLAQLGVFFNTALRHGRDLTYLWAAIEADANRLVSKALQTDLDHLASFLDTARLHKRDVERVWRAIEQEPDWLAERALVSSLESVGSFLEAAKRHGRDVAPLWEAIEGESKRLCDRVTELPLEQVAGFQGIAKAHGRDTTLLWNALVSTPKNLSLRARRASTANLAGFFHYAPARVLKIALADFQSTHWDDIPLSESLVGVTWVAARCSEADRDDLRSAIVHTLFRRKSTLDFPAVNSVSLANVAWLLTNAPSGIDDRVEAFLNTVCNGAWLNKQFSRAPCGPLAKGLRLLSLHESTHIRSRFQHPSMGLRIQNELKRFDRLLPPQRSAVIQFVGCSTLFGCFPSAGWFTATQIELIAALPVDAIPHRPEATKVEDWQLQLWLGLRAVANAARTPLPVPKAVISKTLSLWRANLSDSDAAQSETVRMNREMVAWLEMCLLADRGLLPSPGCENPEATLLNLG